MSALQTVRTKHGVVYTRRLHSCQSPEYLRSITPMQKGSANPAAKLTEAKARAIFNASGKHAAIALEHGVSETHVGKIKRKEIWKHLHVESEWLSRALASAFDGEGK